MDDYFAVSTPKLALLLELMTSCGLRRQGLVVSYHKNAKNWLCPSVERTNLGLDWQPSQDNPWAKVAAKIKLPLQKAQKVIADVEVLADNHAMKSALNSLTYFGLYHRGTMERIGQLRLELA